ncbi:hypothetical protein IQ225_06245 [Synechocystis salina LEGE 06155]|nr:hypothetical protein [Synechocystis salina LEGE 06155]
MGNSYSGHKCNVLPGKKIVARICDNLVLTYVTQASDTAIAAEHHLFNLFNLL